MAPAGRIDSSPRQRHRLHLAPTYDDKTGEARPFRSGYVNAERINGDSVAAAAGDPT
jgi:hypothetical protein